MKQNTIAIIGAGVVGSTTAYTVMMKDGGSNVILVDINDIKCHGEVLDLSDTLSFSTISTIQAGTLQEAGQADIAIITAGIPQKPGQSRTDLLKTNHEVIRNIINGMKPLNPDMIIIVVTNPVDILTYVAQQIAGLPKHQIFGSGTFLDTQRLRNTISKKTNIAEQSIHVYVLGEHGDSQFVGWSCGTIAGVPILEFPQLSFQQLQSMAQETKEKAYNIIKCKGSTAFGISSCVWAYCENILNDTKRIVPVSCYYQEFDVCLSLPTILGKKGVEQIILPQLNDQELQLLKISIDTIKTLINTLD